MSVYILLLVVCCCLHQFTGFDFVGDISRGVVKITDKDNSTFTVKKLPPADSIIPSCYEIQRGNETNRFCYPAVNIVGVGKCGTSALYMLLTRNPSVKYEVHNKEYCPSHPPVTFPNTLYAYLKGFVPPSALVGGLITVNGCIWPDETYYTLHRILLPKAVPIMMIRSLPERQWASYNYWCSPIMDRNCTPPVRPAGPHVPTGPTTSGMYRSPELFHELIKSSASPLSNKIDTVGSCGQFGQFYTNYFKSVVERYGASPFLLAKEALESPMLQGELLERLEAFININLGASIRLRRQDISKVNTGNVPGESAIDLTDREEGLYKHSGFRPMLRETVKFIAQCWKECEQISAMVSYNYTCWP